MYLLALTLVAASPGPYTDFQIHGWTVRVETAELNDPTWVGVEAEVKNQLYRISRVVPDEPLAKMRKITIWVHTNDPATPCMAYHPGRAWLSEHGSDPDMALGVQISNAKNFISWTYEQPWMLLHEMAHGYHHQYLKNGFENQEVKSVWDAEMASKKYSQVLHYDGRTQKHYAEMNQMEFFAESTEAYFGQNDFYPFVNAELKVFDPDAFKLMESIWGKPQKRS